MATLTLEQLQTSVLGRAQMDADDPGAENIVEYINDGIVLLRSILLEHRPSGFEIEPTPASWVTVAGVQTVDLPEGMDRLEGVDVQISGRWYPAIAFVFADRHKYGQSKPWTLTCDGKVSALYTVVGNKLFFQDPPDAVYNGRTYYVPEHEDLVDPDDPVELWKFKKLVIDYAAQMCLEDDELDASHLEKSVMKWEARIRKMARRRDRSGHTAVRDVTGATNNLRFGGRERLP